MSFEKIIFYIFAAITVFAAFRVITSKNPVYAALYLVLTFFTSAALWLLLHAEFLAIVLVLVYVGAVMVLFLFVVMMLDINIAEMREGFARYLPVAALVAVVMLTEMIVVFINAKFETVEATDSNVNNIQALGELLYTKYLYPFEIAAVILLVAIIAAIVLTLRRRPETKHQDVGKQVRVKKEDRLRLVKSK